MDASCDAIALRRPTYAASGWTEIAFRRMLSPTRDAGAYAALAAARVILVMIRREKVEPWVEQLGDHLRDAGPWR
ncbi:MAG: hypothetical protein JO342_09510 [Solirubrobacterales bacterium]|nr:hypothetical protein [Solirubrobacterales bacterium]